jgi:hypothetical protein
MMTSEEISGRLDRWSKNWNRKGQRETREELLDFLKRWRSAGGQWFEQTAKEFFPRAGDIIPSGNWGEGFEGEIQKLHFANHTIWHFEDEVRRDDVAAEWIVEVKRGIDAVNQQRNNQMENIDEWVLREVGVDEDAEEIPVHSEPPGLMLDRFSILSLKIYHYGRQGKHSTLSLLDRQRMDLGDAFDRAIKSYTVGELRFRIYRQCKTYNDPDTNPLLKGED